MSQYSDEPIIDVDRQRQRVGQILEDPTLFPVEFLNWLKRYIEQSGIMLPASSIIGVPKPGGPSVGNIGPGVILPIAGATVPPGALLCDGAVLNVADYPHLAEQLGDTWGDTGDPLTFKVPDLRDRALFGAGSQVALGETDGLALAARGGPDHHHSFSAPVSVTVSGNTGNGGAHGHSITVNGVGDHTHNFDVIQADGYQMLEGQQSLRTIAKQLISTLTTHGGGGHGHGASASGASDHTHPFSGSGSGTAAGDTGGGFDSKPSYAGVNYIITTGQ